MKPLFNILVCQNCWSVKKFDEWIALEDAEERLLEQFGEWDTIFILCPHCESMVTGVYYEAQKDNH